MANTKESKEYVNIKQDLRYISPFRQKDISKTNNFKLKNINYCSQQQNNKFRLNDKTSPIIYIDEFQPTFLFKWTKKLEEAIRTLKGAVNTAGTILNGVTDLFSGNDANTLNGKISNLLLASDANEYARNTLTTPMELINKMFEGGKYVGKFELPYYPETVLYASGDQGWSNTKAEQTGIIAKFQNFMDMDIPYLPEWKVSEPNNSEAISLTLNLYNDSFENLQKNFKFIHSFVPGAFWMQIGYLTKSPNVYTIRIPGKLTYTFAGMSVKVKEKGNQRKLYNESYVAKLMTGIKKSTGNDANEKTPIKNNFFYREDMKFPDAYELEITFTSLVPNHFNAYIYNMLYEEEATNESRSTVSQQFN